MIEIKSKFWGVGGDEKLGKLGELEIWGSWRSWGSYFHAPLVFFLKITVAAKRCSKFPFVKKIMSKIC